MKIELLSPADLNARLAADQREEETATRRTKLAVAALVRAVLASPPQDLPRIVREAREGLLTLYP
jgi:hypothetical protein